MLSAQINSLQFENLFIAISSLIVLTALFDTQAFLKLVYLLFSKFKTKKLNKINWRYHAEEAPTKKQTISTFIAKLLTILRILFLDPFNLRKFVDKSSQRLKIWRFQTKIPFLAAWGGKLFFINAAAILILIPLIKKQFLAYPQYTAIFPKEGEIWNDYTKPVEIEFNIPIDQKSLLINIAPETKGEWKFEKCFSFLPFVRKIKFYPEETVLPGQDIMIYFTDLSNHFHTVNGGEHLIQFDSITLPEIESTTPADKAEKVPIDEEIVIKLNNKDGDYINWEFKCDKDIKLSIQRDNSTEISLLPETPLAQNEKYTIEIYMKPISMNMDTREVIKEGENKELHTFSFTTVKAPLIASMEPTGTHILSDSMIKIVFDNEMDQGSVEKAFSTDPEIAGTASWEDHKTFIFTPENLQKATHYEVKLQKGIKSQAGGTTKEDIPFTFDTIGAVKVSGFSPGYSATGIKQNSTIRVTFDQAVEHGSAQNKFALSPHVNGSFAWSGNTIIFTPSSLLSYGTQYTVAISSDVQTVHGLNSTQNFSSHFTIESQVFSLNVPLYRQTHTFTCNVTAAAMVIAYKGVSSSEMAVYNSLTKDSTPCQQEGGNITYWGNPNVGYVGNIDGGGDCGGYGVHWSPISSYISSKGISNRVYSGWNVAALAREVEKGHPAVIWGQNGWAAATWRSWNSPTGSVKALNGMHSEVVIGFIGSSSNPTHIITNDPWRGRRTLTVGTFNGIWSYFNNTAIVVY